MNHITKRLVAPVGAALVVGTAGFAFMASNAVPQTRAGEAAAQIAGYTVSDITYGYTYRGGPAADALTSVSFTLDARATTVNASIEDSEARPNQVEFRSCTTSNLGTRWTCTPVNQSVMLVGDAATLHVSAAQ